MPEELEYEWGHCKVIARFDDKDTADWNDDELQIYDPLTISVSPRWVSAKNVIDAVDIYLATVDPESESGEST